MAKASYKVVSEWFCMSAKDKGRKIENHLNRAAEDGWELAALDPVFVLGCDIGFYLVLKRANSG